MGALSRWGVSTLVAVPWATFVVNVLGSILLGFLVAATDKPELRLLLGTGFLGAFTTFSTFSVESMQLVESGEYGVAAASVLGNLVLGLSGAALGLYLGARA